MITAMTGGKNPVEFYVDDEDAWVLEYRWHPHYDCGTRRLSAIQATIKQDEKQSIISLHRMLLKQGKGNGSIVDHRDGNPANNCKDNLRLCSSFENARNKKRSVNNSTGYKGVGFHKPSGKYRARIRINGNQICLGYFDTAEEAHEAYCIAAQRSYGEFARVV